MLGKTVKTIPVALVASGIMLASPAFEAKASDPFLGTIQAFGFNYAPKGWALCDGQLLSISENQALFALLGNFYGGDGRTTFGLPDLRGRVAIGQGRGPGLTNRVIGQLGGAEAARLSVNQMPTHNHVATVKGTPNVGDRQDPTGSAWAAAARETIYKVEAPSVDMHAGNVVIANSGGSQGFQIMQPFQVINYSCALEGIFPPRN